MSSQGMPPMSRSSRQGTSMCELKHCTPLQIAAMEEVEKAFLLSTDQLDAIVHGFRNEMKTCLEARSPTTADTPYECDTKMIPSYVTGYPTGNEIGTYLALEISGVDIYVCQVQLKGEGGKLAIDQYQYKIPDDLAAGDDISVLIDYVADCVADYQRRMPKIEDNEQSYAMAISIGFAVRQTSLDQGIIVALEHGFEFPNAIGCDAVQLFHKQFQKKGLAIKIVAIANDAVCTLLAHAYQHPTTRIGIVHSAGTNCAYYDKVSNMSKFLAQRQSGHDEVALDTHMIINTEWCSFGSSYLLLNEFDRQVDRESNNRGIHLFEKMTTGMYLGEIVRQILVELVDRRHLLFAAEDRECPLRSPYEFDTSYMYVCEADDDLENLEKTRVVLEDMYKVGETTLADREMVKKVCGFVGHRAAVLLGAGIAGVVKYMHECGVGHLNQNDGLAISISGDVYKHYPLFHPRMCETLKALLPNQVADKLSVGIVKHSRIVGAAIVAMMAEKNGVARNNNK